MFNITLPKDVASSLKSIYSQGVLVLEYGSGGSTFLALESNPQNIVYSCETDARWLSKLSTEVASRHLNDRFFPVFQDIGETKVWGHPCFEKQPYDENRGKQFFQAPILPWRILRNKGLSPDVVLIDGRFRVASFIAAYLNATSPCTIIFDDYQDRAYYHVVEDILKPSRFVGRAAFFDLQPSDDVAHIRSFLELYGPYMVAYN